MFYNDNPRSKPIALTQHENASRASLPDHSFAELTTKEDPERAGSEQQGKKDDPHAFGYFLWEGHVSGVIDILCPT